MDETTYTERECWVDGTYGWRGVLRVCELAHIHGWESKHWAQLAGVEYPNADGMDLACWLADEAEAWLNANVAKDGWAFYWEDGEFWHGPIPDGE